jgi:hypothetical protein
VLAGAVYPTELLRAPNKKGSKNAAATIAANADIATIAPIGPPIAVDAATNPAALAVVLALAATMARTPAVTTAAAVTPTINLSKKL